MAHLHCEFFSDVLGQSTTAEVLLPEKSEVCTSFRGNAHPGPFPVLYLLHGYNGDETVWSRYTALERYAGRYPFAVVMPRATTAIMPTATRPAMPTAAFSRRSCRRK